MTDIDWIRPWSAVRRVVTCTVPTAAAVLVFFSLPAFAFDHDQWTTLLQRYVDDTGHVAYRDLAAHDRTTLDAYLRRLAVAAEPSEGAAAKALWINAYNAGVVAAVLEGYTADGIFARRSLFKGYTFTVAGRPRTLDEIEHGIIRPHFHDPRTHFALVCASSSCPVLRRSAYEAATLDAALDEAARRFINDPTRNVIDPAHGTVRLSAIFDWFGEDFVATAGSVQAFVARYVASEPQRELLHRQPTLTFLDYDWALNAQAGQRPR